MTAYNPAQCISPSALFAAMLIVAASSAQASVEISSKPTHNMNCTGGVCTPTAKNAVLNATDLANMLASGDVKVTTGSGATNIVVKAAFSWTSTSRLTLDAIQSVEIDKPVMVTGTGAVTVTTNDGGTGGDLIFDGNGNVTFWGLSSSLIVNGDSYTLVGDITTLASVIASNPSGFYALANDYDASVDGTYSSAPIGTIFAGIFDGLGHDISNLKINSSDSNVGFFVGASGTLRDLGLTKIAISGASPDAIGALLGSSVKATIIGCYATGSVVLGVGGAVVGGLVGQSQSVPDGIIVRSHTAVSISASTGSLAGGLVGLSVFTISLSYATGRVTVGDYGYAGGLIGEAILQGKISQSYATAAVTGGANARVGGLAGFLSKNTIENSYAIGSVEVGHRAKVGGFAGEIASTSIHDTYSTGHVGGKTAVNSGGFIGQTDGGDTLGADYFDIDTSGKSRRQGCGNGCDGQVKGKRTEELQSGLPNGFDPNIWGENASINGGFPYLLANPPL